MPQKEEVPKKEEMKDARKEDKKPFPEKPQPTADPKKSPVKENFFTTAKHAAQEAISDAKVNAMREGEIRDLLAKSEISLALDTYDDIFSDFDPRPFSERALSDDFLNESRKAARDKPKSIALNFLVPEPLRNGSVEAKIKKRLKEHFKRHHDILVNEQKSVMRLGVSVALAGFVLMMAATYLYDIPDPHFGLLFLRTMIEPSGWFMVWFGLDKIFYTKDQHKPEIEFYFKMSNATITFSSY